MKPYLKLTLLTLILLSFIQCNEVDLGNRKFPALKTLSVTEITTEGAVFNAEITFRGDFQILNYGFVWAIHSNPEFNSERISISENIQSDHFSIPVTSSLEPNVKYFVKCFVETAEHTVFGQAVEFVSLGSN